jgi:hypothetical protein
MAHCPLATLFVLLLGSLLCPKEGALAAASQPDEKVYKDFIYDDDIRTVEFYRGQDPFSFPYILQSGGSKRLTLKFDELGRHPSNYSVRLVHCNADWTQSQLMQIQYLQGMMQDAIYEYQSSQSTVRPYIHYEYTFPGNDIRFKASGNYALIVYRGSDEDDIVLTRRFVVLEDLVNINPKLGIASDAKKRFKFQQVNFELFPSQVNLTNPHRQLTTYILQNFRWRTASRRVEPSYIHPNKLVYNFHAANEFEGGNEFRRIDLRGIQKRPSPRIEQLYYKDSFIVARLSYDKPRDFNTYYSESDFNGMFYIDSRRSDRPDNEGDYVLTQFRLKMEERLPSDTPVYVYGKLSDWRLMPDFKMQWDKGCSCYKTATLLKQGIYNYIYAVENEAGEIDESRLEGDHYETENYYTILVYFRGNADRYDRLVGLRHINFYARDSRF